MSMSMTSRVKHLWLMLVLGSGIFCPVRAADLTVTGWGQIKCNIPFSSVVTTGNYVCAQGGCAGTAPPLGHLPLSSMYVIKQWGSNSFLLRIPFSCSVDTAGTTLTCGLTNQYAMLVYGMKCSSSMTQTGALAGPAPQSVPIPADAAQLSYGINDRAICYRTATPSAVQCRSVTMSISDLSVGVTSWSIGNPVTVLSANQLDYDGDGQMDDVDIDDDDDGVPDYIDTAPLNSTNANEIVLPVDGSYMGSLIRDMQVQ